MGLVDYSAQDFIIMAIRHSGSGGVEGRAERLENLDFLTPKTGVYL